MAPITPPTAPARPGELVVIARSLGLVYWDEGDRVTLAALGVYLGPAAEDAKAAAAAAGPALHNVRILAIQFGSSYWGTFLHDPDPCRCIEAEHILPAHLTGQLLEQLRPFRNLGRTDGLPSAPVTAAATVQASTQPARHE